MAENTTPRSSKAPVLVFIAVFIPVFLFVVVTATIVTFILPESFASTARVRVETNSATEFETMQSQAVLGPAINKLNLDVEWGNKYNGNAPLKTQDTMLLVRQRMNLAPERNTNVIDITVYSEDRNEAARIANAIADSYNAYRHPAASDDSTAASTPTTGIIDRATPGHAPARPNKPLNITLGALVGILLGSIIGGASAGFVYWFGRKAKK
jgi:capsular polysaccharide biosynthesis protein